MPPGGALPSASEVGVAEPVSGYLAGAPARVRLVVRLGLRALELTALPRRFSRMSPRR